MSELVPRYLRILIRAVAVYAAGAWVAIQLVHALGQPVEKL